VKYVHLPYFFLVEALPDKNETSVGNPGDGAREDTDDGEAHVSSDVRIVIEPLP
jgi:hypothetical protein